LSRFHQFTRGVGSSWLATVATVTYSLLSVPIALRYLSIEEFGLFVLLLQVAAYFSLLEIGMSGATARILVDHKDNPNDGHYGSAILTGSLVFSIQALLILAGGFLAAPVIVGALEVPARLVDVSVFLLRWLAFTSALAMAFRIYGAILYASKRLDLINIFIAVNTLVGLVGLTVMLASGFGLASLVWLFVGQTILGIILPIAACNVLRLLPKRGSWGRPSVERFRDLFAYGWDIFLVNLGNQILEASQLIIITRTMGLHAAAIWSVCTKLFTLIYQLVTRIEGTAIVFFAEMMVRGETERLAARFRQIYQLTAGITVTALAVMVAINKPFVSAWADPSLAWSVLLSSATAAVVFFNAIIRCSSDLIVHTKQIAAFRYVYFVEATVFIILALWLSAIFGFYGVLGASLFCVLLFRATYTTWRIGLYFGWPAHMLWWQWLKRPLGTALILMPFVLSAEWVVDITSGAWAQLFVACTWVGLPGVISLLFVSLPRDVKTELINRWSTLRATWQN